MTTYQFVAAMGQISDTGYETPSQALSAAFGPLLVARGEGGEIRILPMVGVLRGVAREAVREVAHLLDGLPEIQKFLETGNEGLMEGARREGKRAKTRGWSPRDSAIKAALAATDQQPWLAAEFAIGWVSWALAQGETWDDALSSQEQELSRRKRDFDILIRGLLGGD